jgi:hypothetical protein
MLAKHMMIDDATPNVFYAYGVVVEHKAEGYFIRHDGGIPGYYSVLLYFPQSRLTLSVVRNVSGNTMQKLDLQKEVDNEFGNLESKKEKRQLADAYLKSRYPTIFKQKKVYDFTKPIVKLIINRS